MTRLRCLGGAVLALALMGAAANAATPLPPESLLAWQYVTQPNWSPDGRQLTYLRVLTEPEDNRYRAELWLTDTNGKQRRLSAPGASVRQSNWLPDGRAISYLLANSGQTELRVLPMRGGESSVAYATSDQVLHYAWSPVTDSLVMLVRSADEEAAEQGYFVTRRLDARRDGRPGYRGVQRARLKLLTGLGTGDVVERWLTAEDYDAGPATWKPDGSAVFFSRIVTQPDDRELFRTDVFELELTADSKPRALTTQPGPDGNPVVSPDGRWLAVTGFALTEPLASYQTSELTLIDLSASMRLET